MIAKTKRTVKTKRGALSERFFKTTLRLHIVDGKFAMLTIIGKPEKERTIIKINQEESVKSLREMFLSLWEKSKGL